MEEERDIEVEVGGALAGERVDRAVALVAEVSRAVATALCEAGDVTVCGLTCPKSQRLLAGELLRVRIRGRERPVLAEELPTILYGDDDLLVVEKPANLVVHAAMPRDPRPTLIGSVLRLYPEIAAVGEDPLRPGVVHRLDRGTSGVMLVARSQRGFEALKSQLSQHLIERRYLALVQGVPAGGSGVVDAPLGRDLRNPRRVAVVWGGKRAVTRFRLVGGSAEYSLLEVRLETGRTHQIRVHMASVGLPLAGDDLYGVRVAGLERPFLHSQSIAFIHPFSKQRISVTSPLPGDLVEELELLGIGYTAAE